ncbi:unnamed protein product, partial [Staurois parvus]
MLHPTNLVMVRDGSGGFLVLGGSIISLCPSENSSITPYSSSSSLYSS